MYTCACVQELLNINTYIQSREYRERECEWTRVYLKYTMHLLFNMVNLLPYEMNGTNNMTFHSINFRTCRLSAIDLNDDKVN